jgi:tetratricopeptide (TPR) repeat protein
MKMRSIIKHFKWKKAQKFSQGAITLFLAVLLMPFITIALILVQVANYNAALSALDEAMGLSSNATLAHYDNYLQERFGLYAVSQGVDLEEKYLTYLDANSKILGKSFAVQNTSVNGEYPLSDFTILKHQLMEFSKLAAPTELFVETFNIQDLINKLESFGNLGDIVGMLQTGVDVASSMKDAYDSLESAKTHAKNLEATGDSSLRGKYDKAYEDLKIIVQELSEALPEPDEPLPEDYSDELVYYFALETYNEEIEAIENLRNAVDDAKTACLEANRNIQKEILLHRDAVNGFMSAIDDLDTTVTDVSVDIVERTSRKSELEDNIKQNTKDLDTLKEKSNNGGTLNDSEELQRQMLENAINEDTDELSDVNSDISLYESSSGAADTTRQGMSGALQGYNDATAQYAIDRLVTEYNKINDINSDVTDSITPLSDAEYHIASAGGYVPSADIDAYFKKQQEKLAEGSWKALLDGAVAFINSVFEMDLLYKPEYSATIDANYYNSIGGLPGGSAANSALTNIINRIANICKAAGDIAKALSDPNPFTAIITVVTSVINIVKDVIKFFTEDLPQFINDIIQNLTDLFNVEKWWLSTYNAYNMACRTEAKAKMAGMVPALPEQGYVTTLPFVGGLAALGSIGEFINGTGDDLAFSGAELEYMLVGTNSEIANQAFVFVELYLLRLVLDVIPVLANSEVAEIAAAANVCAPVVYIVEIFAEPLTDVLLLVNGEKAPLIKTKIHLTPSGLMPFIGKFLNMTLLGDDIKNKIQGKLSLSAFGFIGKSATGSDGILQMSYRDHGFVLLLATVTIEQQTARIANIAQMEGSYHYQNSGFTFKLKEAYTFVKSETGVTVKQFMPSLIPDSLFSQDSITQMRGY